MIMLPNEDDLLKI